MNKNLSNENRKVVLIGTGMVGMSYAYALLNQAACDELVLVDIDKDRAGGEAMDLNHGLAFSTGNMEIYAGEYSDCANADIVTICAGVAQKPGESRTDLLQRNAQVFRSIIEPVTASGFQGIFLIATNPVDIMSHIALCWGSIFQWIREISTLMYSENMAKRNLFRGPRQCWQPNPFWNFVGSQAGIFARMKWKK